MWQAFQNKSLYQEAATREELLNKIVDNACDFALGVPDITSIGTADEDGTFHAAAPMDWIKFCSEMQCAIEASQPFHGAVE